MNMSTRQVVHIGVISKFQVNGTDLLHSVIGLTDRIFSVLVYNYSFAFL